MIIKTIMCDYNKPISIERMIGLINLQEFSSLKPLMTYCYKKQCFSRFKHWIEAQTKLKIENFYDY